MLRIVFMSVVALFLLGLYAYAIIYCIQTQECINTEGCVTYPAQLSGGVEDFLTTIGGLVSALVISVLAITPPTGSPTKTIVANLAPTPSESPSETTEQFVGWITYIYLGIWLIGGMAMVIWGMAIHHEKPLSQLTDAAKGWLGLAIAAAYAFFGLKPVSAGSNAATPPAGS